MADGDPIFIDDAENADWLRSMHWDLHVSGPLGTMHLVTTVDDLLIALHVADADDAAQKKAVQHFLTLPAARPMPSELRDELEQQGYTVEQ